MNHLDTSCPCNPCPGGTCSCGCQASTTNAAATTDCACKGRCGCDAAEQGCLC